MTERQWGVGREEAMTGSLMPTYTELCEALVNADTLVATLRQQRDDLLKALKGVLPYVAEPGGDWVLSKARALIKSITDAETGTEDERENASV